ncbi:MAG: N-acetylglucosamine-6-phosphate deacetylase [Chloroflexota bacterium]
MSRIALLNGRIVLPHRILEHGALLIEDGRITAVLPKGDLPDLELGNRWSRVDAGGRLISPGLVDIHIHGAVGHAFNTPTVEGYQAIVQENARRGITSLLATTVTAGIPDLVECLAFVQEWMSTEHSGAEILGCHVEGPYFSLAQAGAQDPAHIRNPDDGTPEQLLSYGDCIRLFSFAPELPGSIALLSTLQRLNIVAAAGHSNATEDELQRAIDGGLRHMIHIWSGQSSTVRVGPWRKPGLLEVTLTYDVLTAEMIADNRHLPPTLMKLAYKCLGPDRLCVISDATSGAGLPDGARFQMGGLEYDVHNGVGMLPDRSSFAGSTTLLNQMVGILVQEVGIPLIEAIRMASLTPARIIGMDSRKGSLQPGKDADVVIFDDEFNACGVLTRGRWALEMEEIT